jgi:hypothetical protein
LPSSQQNLYDDNPYLSIGKSPGHLSQALNVLSSANLPQAASNDNTHKLTKKGSMFGGGLANKLFSRDSGQVPTMQQLVAGGNADKNRGTANP